MKTMTINEFLTFLRSDGWERKQEIEIIDDFDRHEHELDEDGNIVETRIYISGCATMTSTKDGVSISYREGFEYQKYMPDTFESSTDGIDEIWDVEGVVVVDDDKPLTKGEIISFLVSDDDLWEFRDISYNNFVETIDETIDIDTDTDKGDDDMETFILKIDNKPNFRFTGEVVAEVSSSPNNAMGSYYSGEAGRWTELALYKTKGGNFICHQIGRTKWEGERDRFSGKACKNIDEVKEFFGHGWLAKELYEEAGINDVIDVE